MVKDYSLESWINLLETTLGLRIELGLANIQQAAAALDLLSLNAPVIIVGGTNGKGSTVRALETIYHTAGYRTASYTSPHLFVFNERIKLDTHNIDDETLCQAFAAIYPTAKHYHLSYFEVTTLAAFWIFKQVKLDIIILEVGLGGRLDAVNIIDPVLSIITSIDLDHTDKLGETRELIAKEKAGIFRENTPVICGDPNPPGILQELAKKLNAPFYCVNVPISSSSSMLNDLLPENMNTAVCAVMQLQSILPVSQENIIKGLKNTHLAGRQQMIYKKCLHIFDVAHNPAGLKKLAQRIKQENKKTRVLLVIGMLATKDLIASFDALKEVINLWFVAPIQHQNAASLAQLTAAIDKLTIQGVQYFENLNLAYGCAFDTANADDLLVVGGSFHTVEEIFLGNFIAKQAPPPLGFSAVKLP